MSLKTASADQVSCGCRGTEGVYLYWSLQTDSCQTGNVYGDVKNGAVDYQNNINVCHVNSLQCTTASCL